MTRVPPSGHIHDSFVQRSCFEGGGTSICSGVCSMMSFHDRIIQFLISMALLLLNGTTMTSSVDNTEGDKTAVKSWSE